VTSTVRTGGIESEHCDPAAVAAAQTLEDLDGRGLARAIAPGDVIERAIASTGRLVLHRPTALGEERLITRTP
jgi:hypothetical protein